MLGSTKLVKDRSLHSITPYYFKDVVLGFELEGIELLDSQALTTVYTLLSLVLSFSLCSHFIAFIIFSFFRQTPIFKLSLNKLGPGRLALSRIKRFGQK